MTLLGTIGMFGLGTVLMGEPPRRRPRAGLVSAALLASGLGSMVLGLGFAVVASSFQFRALRTSAVTPAQAALFAAGGDADGGELGVRPGHHRSYARWAPALAKCSICRRQASGFARYGDPPP